MVCLVPILWQAFIGGGDPSQQPETFPTAENQPEIQPTYPPRTTPPNLSGPSAQPGIEWFAETVDASPEVGIFSSLAAAPGGSRYVAYLDDRNDDLKIAAHDGEAWSVGASASASEGRDGWYPSLVADEQGTLHLAYFAYSRRQILYGIRQPSGEWSYETAVPDTSALDVSLAVTSGGVPHIFFYDEESGEVREAVKLPDGWLSTSIGSGDPLGGYVAAAGGAQGEIHVAFKAAAGGLVYAHSSGGGWALETVDGGTDAGFYPSLSIDGSGSPRIAYYDAGGNDLKYAYQDDAGWHTVTVDHEGSVGQYPSLAVDNQGNTHISYYDEGNTALKYALEQGGQWQTSLVSDEGDVGKYSALALVEGTPWISYYDESEQHLMVAYANSLGSPPPAALSARHRAGQTFLTWTERSDLRHEIYRVYRSSTPIERANFSQAELLAEVSEATSIFWANYRVGDGIWKPRLSKYLITADGAQPLGKGKGVFVWTLPEQAGSSGTSYYAVTVRDDGGIERFYDAYNTGPVKETPAEPQPVEITHSPGLVTRAGEGGHYYIQYMDFRRWNPTFHAPNPTNSYYGLSPEDPQIPTALAYAYDYTVYEPTSALCGGSIPETLPVLVFLHGARGNRYPAPEVYPYPYCAYGVYPIDESETWYFGFARRHDYRSDVSFSPDDVIENYTEQRVLRMVYDLIQHPPGPPVDTQRLYLFGHSMGGTGSLAFAQRYPHIFAAIYSGQPVTWFYATIGYDETWPTNLATKWGPQELNLPISLSAPGSWGEPLQKFNNAGVFTWQNLRAAFDPDDPLSRLRDDMVPLGIDHGTTDDSVLFATQGQPLYPLLNEAPVTWGGAVTNAAHEWSGFGWPLPNLVKRGDIPFWGFRVIRDETVPGISNLSSNPNGLPAGPVTYNQTILWSASWNAWDGAPVDQPGAWQMSFCAAAQGEQTCGGAPVQADITPRRLQQFTVTPGISYRWENRQVLDGELVASGTVTADHHGLVTIPKVTISPQGNRIRIFRP